MEQRYLKVGLALAVGLLAGFWCLNNLLNLEIARGAVAYTLSQQDQAGYAVHIIPPVESPVATTLALAIICLAEAAAAALALWGAWRMWAARRLGGGSFAAAKRLAVLGSGIAVLNWFLGFQVIGGAGIMMGQAEGLQGTIEGAFRFGSYSFLTLIYLSLPEPELPAS
jgi:predicted small integral membrane protein